MKHVPSMQELVVVYKNDGEKWRVMSTTKAIQAIKKYPKEITTLEVRSGPRKCGLCLCGGYTNVVDSFQSSHQLE